MQILNRTAFIRLVAVTTLVAWPSPLVQANNNEDLASFRELTVEEQQEVLDLILNQTQNSGFLALGRDLESEPAVHQLRNFISEPLRHYEFSFGINRMLQDLFQDAHTRVEVKEEVAMTQYKVLDLCLAWLYGDVLQLVNTCETGYANPGDLVTSFGGLTSTDIFSKLVASIPHENDFFLEALPPSWLVREDFLAYFGVLEEDSTVNLVLEDPVGNLRTVSVPLEDFGAISAAAELQEGSSESFVTYELFNETSTAVFKLDECIFNDEYMAVLQEFWNVVLKGDGDGDIDTVVLDLRENRGGDITVALAFLNYITRDPYTLFDVEQRQSDELCNQMPQLCAPEVIGFMQQLGVDTSQEVYELPGSALSIFLSQLTGPPPDTIFDGSLYVLISGETFSSAHLFAGVVLRNNLGTLVGTMTGNTPNFWGNLLRFDVPYTDLTFLLASSKTILYNVEGSEDGLDAVYPQILVPTTLQDISEGWDAQLEYVLGNNRTKTHSDDDDSSGSTGIARSGSLLVILPSLLFLLLPY